MDDMDYLRSICTGEQRLSLLERCVTLKPTVLRISNIAVIEPGYDSSMVHLPCRCTVRIGPEHQITRGGPGYRILITSGIFKKGVKPTCGCPGARSRVRSILLAYRIHWRIWRIIVTIPPLIDLIARTVAKWRFSIPFHRHARSKEGIRDKVCAIVAGGPIIFLRTIPCRPGDKRRKVDILVRQLTVGIGRVHVAKVPTTGERSARNVSGSGPRITFRILYADSSVRVAVAIAGASLVHGLLKLMSRPRRVSRDRIVSHQAGRVTRGHWITTSVSVATSLTRVTWLIDRVNGDEATECRVVVAGAEDGAGFALFRRHLPVMRPSPG
ncbi:hypothetical protein CFP65_2129 [Kitasatospora sp. MMS16-BH015]|nr:hypothetical protein CFP65_2129 [Kitasatospora sp. MMS16-BH015]